MTGAFTLHHGDCLEVLRGMADCSVDSIVTDPPYGLTSNSGGPSSKGKEGPHGRAQAGASRGGFMGMKWDVSVPGVEVWAECLRVLKPGGHLLSFGGSRTYHRLVVAIEDAGFEIRDQIMWLYGSGFPKSHNLDGAWQGWGTALKPAHEPICMARKPFVCTVAANVSEHGTGALNIDGCRVEAEPMPPNTGAGGMPRRRADETRGHGVVSQPHSLGRWPANVIHDGSDEVIAAFPNAVGQQGPISGKAPSPKTSNIYGRMRRDGELSANSENRGVVGFGMRPGARRLDDGSAARFFYCAKASRADRNDGTAALLQKVGGMVSNTSGQHITRRDEAYEAAPQGNHHPTVKPTDLMAYLCRLVTPPGGLVLDPFMGSGSTGKACVREGFRFVGIEREADYLAIARARIENELTQTAAQLPEATPQLGLFQEEAA